MLQKPLENKTSVLVMCQPCGFWVLFEEKPIQENEKTLNEMKPNVVVSIPGRILKAIDKIHLKHSKYFILDECDE